MSIKAKKRKVLRSIGLEPTVVRKQNSAFNPFQAQEVFGCSAKLFGRGGKCSAVRQIGGRVGICSVLGNSTKPISPRHTFIPFSIVDRENSCMHAVISPFNEKQSISPVYGVITDAYSRLTALKYFVHIQISANLIIVLTAKEAVCTML